MELAERILLATGGRLVWGMKQEELARELAREARLPPAVAQERIDEQCVLARVD